MKFENVNWRIVLIRGLIRLYKPKKILEVGACNGGISTTLLNSIKDIKEAIIFLRFRTN